MRVFIREITGNFNHDAEINPDLTFREYVERIRSQGGYFTGNSDVFVPWHRIEFIQRIGAPRSEHA